MYKLQIVMTSFHKHSGKVLSSFSYEFYNEQPMFDTPEKAMQLLAAIELCNAFMVDQNTIIEKTANLYQDEKLLKSLF